MEIVEADIPQKAIEALLYYIEENGWPDAFPAGIGATNGELTQEIEIVEVREAARARFLPIYVIEAKIKNALDKYAFQLDCWCEGVDPYWIYNFEIEPLRRLADIDPRQLALWSV